MRVQVMAWDDAMADARRIREAVFVVEQGVPVELEWDDVDGACDHALAIDDSGRAVGTGRLLPDGHVGRMAVLAEARGHGVGSAMLVALIARARERGMEALMLNAQTHAVPFYERHGFTARGEVFMEAGIPHVEMAQRL